MINIFIYENIFMMSIVAKQREILATCFRCLLWWDIISDVIFDYKGWIIACCDISILRICIIIFRKKIYRLDDMNNIYFQCFHTVHIRIIEKLSIKLFSSYESWFWLTCFFHWFFSLFLSWNEKKKMSELFKEGKESEWYSYSKQTNSICIFISL